MKWYGVAIAAAAAMSFLPAAGARADLLPLAAGACPGADSSPYTVGVLQARTATLCLINAERAKRDLVRLEHDGDLALAAARHAADMVRRDYFSHRGLNGDTYIDRILDTDYVGSPGDRWTFGENIGWGKRDDATPRALVRGWMRSTTHRENILDPRFRNAGVAIALGAPKPSQPKAATYDVTFGVLRTGAR
jgi:uncharacterized protein YkwD